MRTNPGTVTVTVLLGVSFLSISSDQAFSRERVAREAALKACARTIPAERRRSLLNLFWRGGCALVKQEAIGRTVDAIEDHLTRSQQHDRQPKKAD
jgi:hypothetical protein